jgi:hypothetical protein
MTRVASRLTRVLVTVLTASAFACTSTPVRFDTQNESISPEAHGRPVEAQSCGFQLLLLIPIMINSRADRAYQQLKFQTSGEILADFKVSESWFYGLVGTGYCTKILATAYPNLKR